LRHRRRRTGLSAAILLSLGVLAGCSPEHPPIGITRSGSSLAFVVPSCNADGLILLRVVTIPSTHDKVQEPRILWAISSARPRKVDVVKLGRAPAGFAVAVPYEESRTAQQLAVAQTQSSQFGVSEFRTYDDIWEARTGVVLARGTYYSPAAFRTKFTSCG
jgi:hypothetical protein